MAVTQHWLLNDNAASTTVLATVGSNGTLLGGDNTADKRAIGPGESIPYGFSFNGSDDAVDVSASSISFATSTAFSVSLWFRAGETQMQWLGTAGSNTTGRTQKESDTTVRVWSSTTNNTFTVPSIASTTGWNHCLIVRNSSNQCRCWINGAESSTGTLTLGGTWAINRIALNGSGNDYGNGRLASVRIYDSDESANVATIYAETKINRLLPLSDNAASTTVLATVGATMAVVGGENTNALHSFGPGQSLPDSLRLNGIDDYINTQSTETDLMSWGAGSARSVALFFQVRTLTGDVPLIGETSQNIRITSATTIRIGTSSTNSDFTVPTLVRGTWYHLLATRTSGNSWRLFINGTESVTGAQSNTGNFSINYVGRYSTVYGRIRAAMFGVWRSDESENAATLAAAAGSALTVASSAPVVSSFRTTMSTTANALVPVTVAGSGRARAVIVWGNNAVADGVAVDSAEYGWGMGVNDTIPELYVPTFVTGEYSEIGQAAYGQRITHNLASVTDGHRHGPRLYHTGTGPAGITTLSAALTLDEMRDDGFVMCQQTAAGSAKYLHGIMFSGDIDAKLYTATVSNTEGNYIDIPISFEPSLMIVQFQGDPFEDSSSHVHHGGIAISFVKNDKAGNVTYASYSVSHQKEDAANTNNFAHLSATNIRYWDVFRSASGNEWEFTISFPDANTMRVTTVGYGNDADGNIHILALDADWQVAVGIADIGTGTGSQTPTLSPSFGFTPHTMMFAPSNMTALNTDVQSAAAGTSGLGVVTRPGLAASAGDGEYCNTQSNEQGVATTNSQSLSDNQLFNVPLHDGSSPWASAFTSFQAGGFTHNVSAAPGATRKVPFLAIGTQAAGGTARRPLRQTRSMSLLRM